MGTGRKGGFGIAFTWHFLVTVWSDQSFELTDDQCERLPNSHRLLKVERHGNRCPVPLTFELVSDRKLKSGSLIVIQGCLRLYRNHELFARWIRLDVYVRSSKG